ncbi:hypothetical protein GC173_08245 [bacterium]|nr:hypothetical protein [bacterium]
MSKVVLPVGEALTDAYAVRTLMALPPTDTPVIVSLEAESVSPDALFAVPIFHLGPGDYGALEPRTLVGNQRYADLEALDGKDEYATALSRHLSECDGDDPLRGYILANLGILAIKSRDYTKALEYLGPVSKGVVPSAASHRAMAMRRYAWVLHKTGRKLEAYLAYRQIMTLFPLGASRDTAVVEAAGCYLELCRSAKGDLKEFRLFVERERSQIGESARVRLDLMNAESFYYSQEYVRSTEELHHFLASTAVSEYPSEHMMGRLFLALSYGELGDLSECLSQLDVIERDASEYPTTAFEGFEDFRSTAIGWRNHYMQLKDNSDEEYVK